MTRTVIVRLNGREYHVKLDGRRSIVNGRELPVHSVLADGAEAIVIQSGSHRLKAVLDVSNDEIHVLFHGHDLTLEYETERHRLLQKFASTESKSRHHADIKASMPGLVVRVNCQAGMEVRKGQPIIILEAMKMENEIRSPVDGRVKEVCVKQGLTVEKGDLLVVLE